MAKFEFEDLGFTEEKDSLKIRFLKIYESEIPKSRLKKLGKFIIKEHSIEFPESTDAKASKQFNFLLSESFKNLKNKITGKNTIYIHKNSGIPLIGNLSFGIIDRNTNLIEVKPITGCNLDCIFCSIDQTKRAHDFVVEEGYIVEEIQQLIKNKESDDIEIHIGTHGEPMLYEPIIDLIRDVSAIPQVKVISMNTNGTMITKDKADQMIDAGFTRFNLSINAIDPELAEKMAGRPYNLQHLIDLAEHISKKGADMTIAPVLVPGINDKEMPSIIKLAKRLNCRVGIQNFLEYRFGKKPEKSRSWEEFFEMLKKWEREYDVKLLLSEKDFNISKTKKLDKPFKKGDTIKAKIVCPGAMPGEMIAVSDNRTITIPKCREKRNKEIKIKITRDKHNIFYGSEI